MSVFLLYLLHVINQDMHVFVSCVDSQKTVGVQPARPVYYLHDFRVNNTLVSEIAFSATYT